MELDGKLGRSGGIGGQALVGSRVLGREFGEAERPGGPFPQLVTNRLSVLLK